MSNPKNGHLNIGLVWKHKDLNFWFSDPTYRVFKEAVLQGMALKLLAFCLQNVATQFKPFSAAACLGCDLAFCL